MPLQQQQQQQQKQKQKKKKLQTKKALTVVPKESRENINMALVSADQADRKDDGAGDSNAPHTAKLGTNEKPALLHASSEHLALGLHQQSNANRRETGINWEQAKLDTNANTKSATNANEENKVPAESKIEATIEEHKLSKSARMRQRRKAAQLNKFVAMDCEMVGVGSNGQLDMLARVSIVNKRGDILLDKYVKPREVVTDYRTSISGIRPHDIEYGEEFDAVQDEVVDLLQGKILVGHAIRNDLAVLQLKHPFINIRDTSRYKPLSRLVSNGRTPSLKRLTLAVLGLEIQTGEHNSVEDARAAMDIYNRLSIDWEYYIQKKQNKNNKHQHHNHQNK